MSCAVPCVTRRAAASVRVRHQTEVNAGRPVRRQEQWRPGRQGVELPGWGNARAAPACRPPGHPPQPLDDRQRATSWCPAAWAQNELYSARVREFELLGRQSHPRTDGVGTDYGRSLNSSQWRLLGNFTGGRRACLL